MKVVKLDVIQVKITKLLIDMGYDNDGVVMLNDRLKEDLGADSLDTVEFVMQLEEMFDIELANDVEDHCQTVRDYSFEVLLHFILKDNGDE